MTTDSKRWKNRTVHELSDFLGRFNDKSISELMRMAVAAIQRLQDDGRGIWIEGSDEDQKWQKSCNDLREFLSTVAMSRHQGRKLEDVLREFVSLFEHSESRIWQLLFQAAGNQAENEHRERVVRWMAFTYRACTYAILASWFDYKQETTTAHIHVSLATGDRTEHWSHEPMQGPPRKHRRGNG